MLAASKAGNDPPSPAAAVEPVGVAVQVVEVPLSAEGPDTVRARGPAEETSCETGILVGGESPGAAARIVSVAVRRRNQRERRDRDGDRRDKLGRQRDEAAGQRDCTANRRGAAADQRDQAADRRDRAADRRDLAAQRCEDPLGDPAGSDGSNLGARARLEAASDRRRAWKDRRAGAVERAEAEHDRDTALADRLSGADERVHAEVDRSTALADRTASATDLEHAGVDALTGMYLRGAGLVELRRQIAQARRRGQHFVVAFIDVDHLKALNDAFGHAAGDRVLLEVATTLAAKLRPDDLVIRYGGDEFVCAIAGMTADDATKRLALVNAALSEGGEPKSVTFGLAELQPGDSPEQLVARADAALYRQRRQQNGQAVAQVWECGDLVVDEPNRAVKRAGSPVLVTDSEFNLLSVLIRNHTRVLPEAQLLGQAWGHPVGHHVLRAVIKTLRAKLECNGPRQIHAVRGSGYTLRP